MDIGVVTNLKSRKNKKGAFHGDRLGRLVAGVGLARQTHHLDDLRGVLEEFIDVGCKYWVSDGGDGTLHWMMNVGKEALQAKGLWNNDDPFPVLVPTNGGTIDFVARKAGISGYPDSVVRSLVDAVRAGIEVPVIELDTLEVVGHRPGDEPDAPSFRRIGFAAAVGGIGQRFFSKYYEAKDPNRWTIIEVSLKAAAGQLASLGPLKELPVVPKGLREYGQFVLSGTPAAVKADGHSFHQPRFHGLHVSSLDLDFGTMRLFPYAREKGKLHMAVGHLSPMECTYKWLYLVLGKPVSAKNWVEFPGETMEVEARDGELLDPNIDGEMFYGLTKVSVRPGPKVRVPQFRPGFLMTGAARLVPR